MPRFTQEPNRSPKDAFFQSRSKSRAALAATTLKSKGVALPRCWLACAWGHPDQNNRIPGSYWVCPNAMGWKRKRFGRIWNFGCPHEDRTTPKPLTRPLGCFRGKFPQKLFFTNRTNLSCLSLKLRNIRFRGPKTSKFDSGVQKLSGHILWWTLGFTPKSRNWGATSLVVKIGLRC